MPPMPRPSLRRRLLSALLPSLLIALIGFATITGINTIRSAAETVPAAERPTVLPVAIQTVDQVDHYSVSRRFVGRIEAARAVDLAFERRGLLVEMTVDEGEPVEMGQILARLDTAPLEAERARMRATRQSLIERRRLAQLTVERRQTLRARGHAGQADLDQAETDLASLGAEIAAIDAEIAALDIELGKSVLKAPFAGTLAARMLDEGAVVDPGMPFARLLETGAMRARIGLNPAGADALAFAREYRLSVGQDVVSGRLIRLRPDLSVETRTVTALFDLSNDAGLLEGQLIALHLDQRVEGSGAWLPIAALSEGEKGLWRVLTLVERDGKHVVGQEGVIVAHVDGERAFVRGSMADGARVITAGPQRVVPGQIVRPIEAETFPPVDDRTEPLDSMVQASGSAEAR